jgi:deoxyadenosine/deoxycytidine kinase
MAAQDAENERKRSGALIAVVGPCAAGKSSLVKGLKARGYNARCVAQDHSYVPDMWRRITNPDLLIYLDVELNTIAQRRRISWGERYLNDERHKLRHARQHCDLYLHTDALTEEEVLRQVLSFLNEHNL